MRFLSFAFLAFTSIFSTAYQPRHYNVIGVNEIIEHLQTQVLVATCGRGSHGKNNPA